MEEAFFSACRSTDTGLNREFPFVFLGNGSIFHSFFLLLHSAKELLFERLANIH